LSLKIDVELNYIEGDGRRIKQVFNNLLTNAIKYMPHKSCIEMAMRNKPGQVGLSISDNSIGIAKKDLVKIFGKFYIGSGHSPTRESC
jgi:two-component system, OmpR family, sensor histidine kinase VicK